MTGRFGRTPIATFVALLMLSAPASWAQGFYYKEIEKDGRMNSNGRLASTSLTPYVKDASLRWTYAGRQQMLFGIQPTVTHEFVESVWGLRHIEKTPGDLYRTDSSRDFGISLTGPLDAAQRIRYHVQVGNESGTNSW